MSYVPYFTNVLLTVSYKNLGKNTSYVVDVQHEVGLVMSNAELLITKNN